MKQGDSENEVKRQTELVAHYVGRVQGVGFRFTVRELAVSLGLRGYVRNRPDGSVELLAQGPRPDLERLLDRIRASRLGRYIEGVDTDWRPASRGHSGFEVRLG